MEFMVLCAHSISLSDLLFLFLSIGTIDMDLITTGVSASERMRRERLLQQTRDTVMQTMQLGGPSVRLLEVCSQFLFEMSTAPIFTVTFFVCICSCWSLLRNKALMKSTLMM